MDRFIPDPDGEREVDLSGDGDGIAVLPDQTRDDTDVGWGERASAGREDTNDERLIAERPPHW